MFSTLCLSDDDLIIPGVPKVASVNGDKLYQQNLIGRVFTHILLKTIINIIKVENGIRSTLLLTLTPPYIWIRYMDLRFM